MSKRSVILSILFALIAVAASVASALAPTVNITNPTNNSTINNIDAPLTVSVDYSDFPDTGSIQLRAWDDTESTLFAQDQNAFSTGASGTWQAMLDFAGSVTAGTHGHITASVLDMIGTTVATSTIQVTYGVAAPPPPATNTPTATTLPTNTPTATATNLPPSGATIAITNPANGATFDINSPIPVSGTTTNLPSGATVLVRLRNGSGSTLGEQGVVPNGDGTWSLSVSKSVPDADQTTTGSIVAFIINSGSTAATSNVVGINFTGITPPPQQPALIISSPPNGSTVDTSVAVVVSGASSNLPNDATITVYAYVNGNNNPVGQQVATKQVNGNFTASITFNQYVAAGTPGSVIAYATTGNSVVATSNQVNLIWGNATSPGVNITQPTNGASVNISQPVHITGTSHNLPVKQVTVIAAFSNGNTINQTTIPVNNAGNWSINLPVGVQPGTAGLIYAIARDSGNNIVAQKSISVTWGSNNASPVVIITNPSQGAVVGVNTQVHVEGFGANSFENNIVVRALDTFGNTLAQQPTTYDQNGFWVVNLNVNVAPGTPGSLFAFITSAQDGSILASSRVNVFYNGQCYIRTDWPIYVVQAGDTLLRISQRVGTSVTDLAYSNCINNANLVYTGQALRVPRLPVTPQPQQVAISILSPSNNTTIDASERVSVTGSVVNLAGNDIVVRALDSNGNLLAQQTTRIGGADASGVSQWQVSLSIRVEDGTHGTIYAVAQTPTTGTILADALINVTYSSNVIVIGPTAGGEQKLFITQPADNNSVAPSGQLEVTGRVVGPFDGDVFVRVIDSRGNVLAETQAQLTPINDHGDFNWQAALDIDTVEGSRGTIYAYVPTPFDATAPIADAVNVIFGQDSGSPYVTINDPLPYQTVSIEDPITIDGTGGRLFEGNVVVRALDDQGNVLTEDSTTINSPNAGTGGEGDWQTTLQVNVAEGTRGSIVAFSTSAQDGSIVAYTSVDVIYGDPTNTANFVKITAPLPGTIADPGQTLMIAGTADRQNGNQVHVQILDEQGNVLVDEPRNLNPSVDGDYGVWQMLIELRGITPGTHLRINALTASRFDGTTLASDSVEIVVGSAQP